MSNTIQKKFNEYHKTFASLPLGFLLTFEFIVVFTTLLALKLAIYWGLKF
jgi:hypothetical protein